MSTSLFIRRLKQALLLAALSTQTVYAADYYVSPSGSDSNPGSLSAPMKTLAKAYSMAGAGTTIYLRGGTYPLTSRVLMNKSGASGNLIRVFAYQNEVPVLDAMNVSGEWNDGSAIRITGNFHHIKGLEIKNGPYYGILIEGSGSYNILERLNVHHSGHRSTTEGKGIVLFDTASNNLILNCDSHHNRDLKLGNADGFQVGSSGKGNVLRGNRAWRNSDDGYDLWNGGATTLENNVAFENGMDDSGNLLGDGNGFKLGGNHAGHTSGGHLVRNNVAWNNMQNGFDENQATYGMTLENNTSFNNKAYNFIFVSKHTLRNNLSHQGKVQSGGTNVTNSWNLSATVSAADFKSLSDTIARGPRQADGSLPDSDFLKLVAGSDLIDKGTNIGLPFTGAKPDLGAYEYSSAAAPAPAPTPTSPAPAPAPAPTPTTPLPAAANLIKNDTGFEQGGGAWENWGNTRITSSQKSSGTYSLQVYGEGGRGQVVNGLVGGKTYVVQAAGRVSNTRGEWCGIGIVFRDAKGKTLAEKTVTVNTALFTRTSLQMTAPAGTAYGKVYVWKDAGSTSCYVDDFSLVAK